MVVINDKFTLNSNLVRGTQFIISTRIYCQLKTMQQSYDIFFEVLAETDEKSRHHLYFAQMIPANTNRILLMLCSQNGSGMTFL